MNGWRAGVGVGWREVQDTRIPNLSTIQTFQYDSCQFSFTLIIYESCTKKLFGIILCTFLFQVHRIKLAPGTSAKYFGLVDTECPCLSVKPVAMVILL